MVVETAATFEALVDVYAGAVFVVDREGRYREVIEGSEGSDVLYDLPESLTGQEFRDVLPPETAERFHRVVREAIDSGTPSIVEYELEVQAGHRWFEATVSPIEDEELVVWAARDVTERKQYERALAALHEAGPRLTASDSVADVCEEAIYAAETILDFDQSMIALERDGVLQAEATSEQLPADATTTVPIDDGIAGRTYRTGESYLTPDLAETDAALDHVEFRAGLSVPIGDHGVFQAVAERPDAFDETDLELAELFVGQVDATITRLEHERALERQNERLDEFASIVSHDLRNPLTVANGRLELAAEECDSEHLEHVADAHDRMQGLIDDLLTLAQSGEDVAVEPVDLAHLVRECWQLIETEDATLDVAVERPIEANRTQLRQLLENLLGNAVEHGSTGPGSQARQDAVEHGSTSPRSQAHEDAVEHGDDGVTITVGDLEDGFYVEDDGPGIDDVDRDRLFEAGYSSADGGTGIGLHIVGSVAERHGWTVELDEEYEDGARFEITGVERPDEY
ncbi:PAS/PAC sensor hybrid histidine kinase [Salinarchaeum sp. Harcht-Bsk1]|uniref:PAS domain-containing sensor histidine kinase n=1 Tax=Salinarchaeum sp. Harcht-Bsk1 TaxID=1333523 RepID=UPI0003423318|nr:ATP-binding protein [Salinarchaeum sp. Harcht-Bsk1]AGN00840.1 PAS/PAC sensor hybrid histidine kinase [Salinarchaeum sp. Harcht-Bsk1]